MRRRNGTRYWGMEKVGGGERGMSFLFRALCRLGETLELLRTGICLENGIFYAGSWFDL
jgi:hypothetical protein